MKSTAGVVLYRKHPHWEVLLAHPGGPFWKNKDLHGWSVPKGEFDPEHETPKIAAIREFYEETGTSIPNDSELIVLPVFTSGRKVFHFFGLEWYQQLAPLSSNYFELEWPPKSGQIQQFPEIDKLDWFGIEVAKTKIHKGQVQVLMDLENKLNQ